MKKDLVEITFVKSGKKFVNLTQFAGRIILPQKFKPQENATYECFVQHTEKIYRYNNEPYKLSLARLFKRRNYCEDIPTGEGTLATALKKAGFKLSSDK